MKCFLNFVSERAFPVILFHPLSKKKDSKGAKTELKLKLSIPSQLFVHTRNSREKFNDFSEEKHSGIFCTAQLLNLKQLKDAHL